jgi:hypothetical protein
MKDDTIVPIEIIFNIIGAENRKSILKLTVLGIKTGETNSCKTSIEGRKKIILDQVKTRQSNGIASYYAIIGTRCIPRKEKSGGDVKHVRDTIDVETSMRPMFTGK